MFYILNLVRQGMNGAATLLKKISTSENAFG
jgi:hypothetical protein